MYNKNRFRKVNEKKLLRKIGKHWVVTSVSLLGALLNVSGLTNQSIQAEAREVPRAKAAKAEGKIAPRRNELLSPQADLTARSVNSSQDLQSTNGDKDLSHQVRSLYQQIMNHARLNTSLHQSSSIDNDQWEPQTKDQVTSSSKVIKGQWGTAPFSFNPKTGLLQTTGKGVISPISQLKNKLRLQNIKDIRFAPGTQAPRSKTLSDGALFGASLDPVQTTDGASDSTAYVSELCNLSDIDCTNLDTSNMTNMGGMFKNDTGLKDIQFGPRFDTHNVTEMSVMFYNDINLQSLDLNHFDTSNVLGLTSMFQSDYALSDLNLGPHFNTGKVAFMSDVFHSDNSLKSLDLGSQFYVSNDYANNSINLSDMFKDDYKLQSLNLGPHFNTSRVNNMSDMFANNSDLTSLNLGDQFYTGGVPDMHNLFKGDTDLRSLNLGPHFDTSNASGSTYSNSVTDGSNTINNDYSGAQDVFAGDDSLDHLIMDNTRLAGPVNLPHSLLAAWRQNGQTVNPADGQVHSGDFGRYATRPVQKTCLNLVDSKGRSIGKVFVNGLSGTNIPFAEISNVLGDGYVPKISTHDIITTYPNSPYKYGAGIVNVTVIRHGDSSNNGNSAPVSGAVSQNDVNSYAASVADQSIESSEMRSVASSVSVANAGKARVAAELADARIATSLKDSVADSVAAANQNAARNAAKLADQKLAASLSNSVAASVTAANQSRANQAARSTDASISTSLKASVATSVSIANSSRASEAAKSADQKLAASLSNSVSASVSAADRSLAVQAAHSADAKLSTSLKASVAASVSTANANRASEAAKSADQKLASSLSASVAASVSSADRSLAAQAARSADAKLSASLSNSVSASVASADQAKASQAARVADTSLESSIAKSYAQSADQSLAVSARASVLVSVSIANHAKAERTARAADQRIQASIAASAVSSADVKLAASERASVADSVSETNASEARAAARSADEKLANSERNSISASVSSVNRSRASSAAKSANAKMVASLSNSVSASVSAANQVRADQEARSASQQAKRSAAGSKVSSANPVTQESLRNSVAASSSAERQRASQSASINAGRMSNNSNQASAVRSTVPQTNSSIAASYSNDADQRIEASLQASIHESLSAMSQSNDNVNRTKVDTTSSTEPRSAEPQPVLRQSRSVNSTNESRTPVSQSHNSLLESATVKPEAPSRPVSDPIGQPENEQSSVTPSTPVNSEALGGGMNNESRSTPVPAEPTNDTDPQAGSTVSVAAQNVTGHARNRKGQLTVTQITVHQRYFMIRKACLAHNHLLSVGKDRDYSTVLRRHATGRIEKAFKVQRGRHVAYRYEVKLGRHHSFITAAQSFVKGTQHRLPNVNHFDFN